VTINSNRGIEVVVREKEKRNKTHRSSKMKRWIEEEKKRKETKKTRYEEEENK